MKGKSINEKYKMKHVSFLYLNLKNMKIFLSRYLIYLFVIVRLTCFSISKTLHRSLHASLHATRTYRLRTHRSKIFSRHDDKNTFGKKRKYVSKKIFDTHFYIARNAITSKQKKKKKKKEKRKNDVT